MKDLLQLTEQTETSANKSDVATRLAVERTRVAYDRTMLAWVRTATGLITFGFTVYKFFQIEFHRGQGENRLIGPREFGLTMVSVGLLSLVMAVFESRQNMQSLPANYAIRRRSLANIVAALIGLLGITALVVMVLRA